MWRRDERLPVLVVAGPGLGDAGDLALVDREELAFRALAAIFGPMTSVMLSSFHPIASAIIATDSVRPT